MSDTFNSAIMAIMMVYFVQGALGLSSLAVTYYLKDTLGLSPAEAGVLLGISRIPWLIKPLYGFLSDGLPLFRYRRRSYLFLSGVLGCLAWLAMGSVVHDYTVALMSIIAGSASVAISDVIADSIVVEQSRPSFADTANSEHQYEDIGGNMNDSEHGAVDIKTDTSTTPPSIDGEEDGHTLVTTDMETIVLKNRNDVEQVYTKVDTSKAGDLQSLCWGASAVGGIMSAYFSGSLLQTLQPKEVFLITALFPLITVASALFIPEKRVPHETGALRKFMLNVSSQCREIFKTLRNPVIYKPVLFLFLWQATPSTGSAMFYFYTNELHFGPEFLGQVRLASSVAALVGVVAFRVWLMKLPTRDLLFWTSVVALPLSLTQVLLTSHMNRKLGIPDRVFTLTDSVVLAVLGQISFMPVLVLAISLCPPGSEGALFAILMSINNLAGTVSTELGAGMTKLLGVTDTNFDALSTLVIICSVLSVVPLVFIDKLLPSSSSASVAEKEMELR